MRPAGSSWLHKMSQIQQPSKLNLDTYIFRRTVLVGAE